MARTKRPCRNDSWTKLLEEACLNGDGDMFFKYIEWAKSRNYDTDHLLHLAVTVPDRLNKENISGAKLEMLRCLVKKGADLNCRSVEGETLVQRAYENGLDCAVKFLVEAGADLDATSEREIASLLLVSSCGSAPSFQNHLDDVVNVFNFPSKCNVSIMHIAAAAGRTDLVKFFLKNGASVDGGIRKFKTLKQNFKSSSNKIDCCSKSNSQVLCSPLHLATIGGHLETVKLLLHSGACATSRHFSGAYDIHYMAAYGDKEAVKMLLKSGADVDALSSSCETPLSWACLNSNINTFKFLLDNRANPAHCNINGVSLMSYAVKGGSVEMVKCFLEMGLELTCQEGDSFYPGKFPPLAVAAQLGHQELFYFLLQGKSIVEDRLNGGFSLLHFTAGSGSIELCKFLLNCNFNINSRNDDKETPLHIAALKGRTDICKLLISKGANTRVVDCRGNSILSYAIISKTKETIECLLDLDPNLVDLGNFGSKPSPVSFCCIYSGLGLRYRVRDGGASYRDFIELFLDCGDDPNSGAISIHTPIIRYWYFPRHLNLLLCYGADVTLGREYKESALDQALDKIKVFSRRSAGELEEDDESEEENNLCSNHNDPFRCPWDCSNELIIAHAMKLKAASLSNVDRPVESIQLSNGLYFEKCCQEVKLLKSVYISEGLTLHSLLSSTARVSAGILRYKDTELLLTKMEPFHEYPVYGCLLIVKLRQARQMKRLLESGVEFFTSLPTLPKLTYDCIDLILSYLSVPNLLALEKALMPSTSLLVNI